MNENFPSPITDESDLIHYENYLSANERHNVESANVVTIEDRNMSYIPSDNRDLPIELRNTAYMPAFLSKHIGKLVRVEHLLGGQLVSRTGILMTVGATFIVLRSKNNATLICDGASIRFVTIIHNNDLNNLLSNY